MWMSGYFEAPWNRKARSKFEAATLQPEAQLPLSITAERLGLAFYQPHVQPYETI